MPATERWFDRYVVVDWSASGTPNHGADSIWVRSLGVAGRDHDVIENPGTRSEARARVRALLLATVERNERVLVGFDFPYAYSRGFAAALGLDGIAWRAVWDHLGAVIVDRPNNASNRFDVAAEINRRLGWHTFWACPPSAACEHLSSRKDQTRYFVNAGDVGLPEWRESERALFPLRRPQTAWKLFTAGSVGSQALVGIPVVAALRDDPALAPYSAVWPFEALPPADARPAIVHAEIWPSLVDISEIRVRAEHAHKVKDQVQVEQLALHLRSLDDAGRLADCFAPLPAIAAEEGWILGSPIPQ